MHLFKKQNKKKYPSVKGNLDEGLIFTGAYGYMQDHLMHVEEVIHELMEDEK